MQHGLKDWTNTTITTDDRDAATTLKLGAVDYNIRLAIDAGAPVEAAYCMGSYNIARTGISNISSAPSRRPLRRPGLPQGRPEARAGSTRSSRRMLAADDHKYLLPIPKIDWPSWATDTMHVGRQLTAKDFVIKAPAGKTEVNAAILTLFYFEPEYMTDTLPVKDGEVQRDPTKMISKVALIDRYHSKVDIGKMFWKTWAPRRPTRPSAARSRMICTTSGSWAAVMTRWPLRRTRSRQWAAAGRS